MKNFWLQRRRKRELARISSIVDAINNPKRSLLNGIKGLGGMFPWQRKKDTKTQP